MRDVETLLEALPYIRDFHGRTVVINPGSEYGNGTIHGAIVALAPDRVVTRQLVVG